MKKTILIIIISIILSCGFIPPEVSLIQSKSWYISEIKYAVILPVQYSIHKSQQKFTDNLFNEALTKDLTKNDIQVADYKNIKKAYKILNITNEEDWFDARKLSRACIYLGIDTLILTQIKDTSGYVDRIASCSVKIIDPFKNEVILIVNYKHSGFAIVLNDVESVSKMIVDKIKNTKFDKKMKIFID